ncbi:MAG: hypothetical protein H7203_03505 [Rhizobacter sp.]|nr:hypothetical protein [Burkholderiales bacterium]
MTTLSFATVWGDTPSSSNFVMPASVINSGGGDMASTNYKLSSSLGDSTFGARQSSANLALSPGFWPTVIGVTQGCVLDIDGDQTISATSDGLMLLRAMLGLTGDAVTAGATVPNANARKTWQQIAPYVHLAALDLDGSGDTSAATDGVLLLRVMFGLTGSAVTQGVVAAGGRSWNDIRTYLNTYCGGNFSP